MCTLVFDYRCRKDIRITLTEVKIYESQLRLFQLFHPFSIILIHEQKFQCSIPAYFVRKIIPQMRRLDSILCELSNAGLDVIIDQTSGYKGAFVKSPMGWRIAHFPEKISKTKSAISPLALVTPYYGDWTILLHYIFVIRSYVASVLESYRPSDYESWRSLQLRSTFKRSSMEYSQVNISCNNSAPGKNDSFASFSSARVG